MKVQGWICGPRIYEFEGWKFEYGMLGVWPLKKNFEPRAMAGKKFYDMLGRFCELSDDQKNEYRIGGGCIPL